MTADVRFWNSKQSQEFLISKDPNNFYFFRPSVTLPPRPPRSVYLQDSSHSLASASLVTGITDMRHHAQLIFVFLVETGFHHVDQDGLDLLTL